MARVKRSLVRLLISIVFLMVGFVAVDIFSAGRLSDSLGIGSQMDLLLHAPPGSARFERKFDKRVRDRMKRFNEDRATAEERVREIWSRPD